MISPSGLRNIIEGQRQRRTVKEQRDYLVGCLKARRRQLGMTQGEVAARISAKKGQVSRWELGKVTPELPCFLRWAAALDCEVHIRPRMGR